MKTRVVIVALFMLLSSTLVQAFTYQGELSQSGIPYNGAADISFTLYDAGSGGTMVGAVDLRNGMMVNNGRFVVELAQWASELDGRPLWLEIAASIPAGNLLTPLTPRQKIDPAPYATYSFDGAGGNADITAVLAGPGLVGGAASGDATLSVDTSQIQQRVTGSCPAGQSIGAIAANGAVDCEVDTDTTYWAGTALRLVSRTFNVNTGAGNGLDADLLDGKHASEIVADANSEVRIPISEAGLTITEPGSYYLTGNLTKLTSGWGIYVTSSNVTIDLMGFTITGAGTYGHGVSLDASADNVVIRNGTIRNFPRSAIFQNNQGTGHHIIVKKIRADGNSTSGNWSAILLSGYSNTVKDSVISNNFSSGIGAGADSLVRDNVVSNNAGGGIAVGAGAMVLNNVVSNNNGTGIFTNNSVVVEGNNVHHNNQEQSASSAGIKIGGANQVSNNNVSYNYRSGIYLNGSGSIIRNNHVTNSQTVNGVAYCVYFASNDNVAIGNTATGCNDEFGGSLPLNILFIDNIEW